MAEVDKLFASLHPSKSLNRGQKGEFVYINLALAHLWEEIRFL
jgi:hypothetical protein